MALASNSLAGYSQQYHSQDGHGSYAYGYADPNSQKSEHRSHDGTTHGEYSYVDGDGKLQAVKYVADHAGMNYKRNFKLLYHVLLIFVFLIFYSILFCCTIDLWEYARKCWHISLSYCEHWVNLLA